MSYEDLMSRIAREIPALAGRLSAPRITYVKSLRKTYITFESTVLAGEKEFLRLERILRETFPGRDLSVRVVSPALRESFLTDFMDMIEKEHGSVQSYFSSVGIGPELQEKLIRKLCD